MKKFALVISAMSLVATAAQAQVLDFEGIAVGHQFGSRRVACWVLQQPRAGADAIDCRCIRRHVSAARRDDC